MRVRRRRCSPRLGRPSLRAALSYGLLDPSAHPADLADLGRSRAAARRARDACAEHGDVPAGDSGPEVLYRIGLDLPARAHEAPRAIEVVAEHICLAIPYVRDLGLAC